MAFGLRSICRAKRIVCGMSGGVDSAVSAHLLKRKGYDVVGLFMKNWDIRNEKGRCSSEDDLEDATYVCKTLDIPLHTVDFVKEYWNEVFSEMISDYESGVTPNPDILCNRQIKFHHFINYAVSKLGADAVATGHYARTSIGYDVLQDGLRDSEQRVALMSAADQLKDQTFFLSQIGQWSLRRSLFPLGHLQKKEVKAIAAEAGMERIAKKKESMGICFIGSRNFHQFIEEYIPPKPGPFIDVETGQIVGCHKGTHYWTLGQRCHLAGKAHAYFVCEVRPNTQEIIVAPGTDHPALFSQHFVTGPCHWIEQVPPLSVSQSGTFEAGFRFQHKHPLISSVGRLVQGKNDNSSNYNVSGKSCRVELSLPMRAITPGQFAVFYKEDVCLGSARIMSIGPTLFDLNVKERVIFPKEMS